MFPTFVTSFQDQFTAVIINLIGTVAASAFSSLFGAFVTTVVTPILKNLAAQFGGA